MPRRHLRRNGEMMAFCKGIQAPLAQCYTNVFEILSDLAILCSIVIFLPPYRVFLEMHNRIDQHQAEKQYGCQRKLEAIQIVVNFSFRNMPNHILVISCGFSVFS